MTTNNLRARVRQLRLAAGHTQESLARAADVSTSLIVQIERGSITSPGLEKAAAIATALGCKVDDLLQPAGGATTSEVPAPPTSRNRRKAK